MSNGPLFATGTFIWGLAAICQLHRRPFAPDLLLQQFPPPYDPRSLQAAALALKLKSGLRSVPASGLALLPTPFIAVLGAQPSTASAAPGAPAAPSDLAVVLGCDGARVLHLTQANAVPGVVPLDEFAQRYAGIVLICTPEVAQPANE